MAAKLTQRAALKLHRYINEAKPRVPNTDERALRAWEAANEPQSSTVVKAEVPTTPLFVDLTPEQATLRLREVRRVWFKETSREELLRLEQEMIALGDIILNS